MSESWITDKRQVRRSFDRAAAGYDEAAVLQQEVSKRMFERLEYIRHQPQRILDAGCGTGAARQLLRTFCPQAQILSLDLSFAMLTQANRRNSWWHRTVSSLTKKNDVSVCADIEQMPLKAGSVDMVWSNLALQWSNNPETAFRELHRVLSVNGLLMFSTFGPDTLKELRQAFSPDPHTHVNHFIDMHDIGDLLGHCGFSTPVMDMEYITLTYTDLKSVMRDLKAIGAHNVTQGRPRGLTGKHFWQEVEARYEQFRREGRLPATFEVVYGHAWKPQPKVLGDGRQIINLDFPKRGKPK